MVATRKAACCIKGSACLLMIMSDQCSVRAQPGTPILAAQTRLQDSSTTRWTRSSRHAGGGADEVNHDTGANADLERARGGPREPAQGQMHGPQRPTNFHPPSRQHPGRMPPPAQGAEAGTPPLVVLAGACPPRLLSPPQEGAAAARAAGSPEIASEAVADLPTVNGGRLPRASRRSLRTSVLDRPSTSAP